MDNGENIRKPDPSYREILNPIVNNMDYDNFNNFDDDLNFAIAASLDEYIQKSFNFPIGGSREIIEIIDEDIDVETCRAGGGNDSSENPKHPENPKIHEIQDIPENPEIQESEKDIIDKKEFIKFERTILYSGLSTDIIDEFKKSINLFYENETDNIILNTVIHDMIINFLTSKKHRLDSEYISLVMKYIKIRPV